MIDTKGFMSVKQYAEHRKVSRQTVYKHIRNGKIVKGVVTVDRKTMIDPGAADLELSQNLDQIHNPGRRTTGRKNAARLEIQEQAADIASTGEKPGHITPWPIWAGGYIGALFNLDPDRVSVEQIDKTHWRLSIDDLNSETGQPDPWSVVMSFDLNAGGQ